MLIGGEVESLRFFDISTGQLWHVKTRRPSQTLKKKLSFLSFQCSFNVSMYWKNKLALWYWWNLYNRKYFSLASAFESFRRVVLFASIYRIRSSKRFMDICVEYHLKWTRFWTLSKRSLDVNICENNWNLRETRVCCLFLKKSVESSRSDSHLLQRDSTQSTRERKRATLSSARRSQCAHEIKKLLILWSQNWNFIRKG